TWLLCSTLGTSSTASTRMVPGQHGSCVQPPRMMMMTNCCSSGYLKLLTLRQQSTSAKAKHSHSL
ncbi:hypothetical protein EV175_004586, partial [Coemansia sp. RSA 1933]